MRTEKSLVRRARAGHEAAFEEIFRRYHQEIFRYCRAIVRNDEDARDALQATMVAALRALPGEEREIELKPWLYRVAHNESVSILRDRQPLIDPQEAPESQVPGADDELDRRQRTRRLVDDLQALPDRQRSVIVMRELSGLSFAEIGAAIGASEATSRQALYEARESLADMEEGRALTCAEVRHAVSDGDGRALRGRRLRAHLRSCEGCTAFRVGIDTRKAELHALCPPLSPVAASGILAAVLASHGSGAAGIAGAAAAGGAGGAGLGGAVGAGAAGGSGALGGGIVASGAVKAVSVLAAVAVGAGAADATGVVHLPLLHAGSTASTTADTRRGPGVEVTRSAPGGVDRVAPSHGSSGRGVDSSRVKAGSGRDSGDGHGRALGRDENHGRGLETRSQSAAKGHRPRGVANANGHQASPSGNAAGHSSGSAGGHSNAGGNATHGSASTAASSSSNSHGGNPNASSLAGSGGSPPPAGDAGSGSSNAGGSGRSSEAPGHNKPTSPPATTTTLAAPPPPHGQGGGGPKPGRGQGNGG